MLPGAHPLWAPSLTSVFEMLGVGASISDGTLWRPIHVEPGVRVFELEHGVEVERNRYNGRAMLEARQRRTPVLGTHAGLSDFFVPILAHSEVEALLVTGPFATTRPTAADILDRWHDLSGRQGHPADPEFSAFTSVLLRVLVLEPSQVRDFERLLGRLALLMSGERPSRPLFDEFDAIWSRLEKARLVERTWSAAREMVDERTARRWTRSEEARGRALFGLPAIANRAVVGLLVSQRNDGDPVAEVVRRDAFQRACVELAHRSGHAISGRVGEHGVTFLSAGAGSAERRRQRLIELADKARTLARKMGFRLHVGESSLPNSAMLPQHYRAALEAAENALSQGLALASAGRSAPRPWRMLADLRREMARLVETRPADLAPRFEHYLEAVGHRSGYRLESARAHLDAGFERIVEALEQSGAFAQANVTEALDTLDRAASRATTIAELFAAFRSAVEDLSLVAQHPTPARRDRNLRRAVAHIHEHYCETLGLAVVARVAGFSPSHFSRLFKAREGATFEQYVLKLRIERAKELLTTSDLDVQRVAELSGLGTRQYLARVFKTHVGMTPRACREGRGRPR